MNDRILVVESNMIGNRIIFLCELKGKIFKKNDTFSNIVNDLRFAIENYTSEFYNNPIRASFEVSIKENTKLNDYVGLEFLKNEI